MRVLFWVGGKKTCRLTGNNMMLDNVNTEMVNRNIYIIIYNIYILLVVYPCFCMKDLQLNGEGFETIQLTDPTQLHSAGAD